MQTTNRNYFRSAGWLKFYGSVTDPIVTEQADRTAAVEHPDVPGRSVGKYRRLTADMLAASAQYNAWAQRNADSRANYAMVGKAADTMGDMVKSTNAWAAYVQDTLGWSRDRASEIRLSLLSEHADRCREALAQV